MEGRYNTRSPAVKRLMREAQELSEPTDQYYAQPLEDNLFEWHFTVRGPADSDFQNGIYHGRIILPVDYPMKPPSIIWLTPNGRFETNKKICLSISGHHPESWQPSWSIRTALLAIIGFMPTRPGGAIGSLDYTPEERKVLAKKSQDWKCPVCGPINQILLPRSTEQPQASQEAKNLAAQIQFQGEKSKSKNGECPITSSAAATSAAAAPSTSTPSTAATTATSESQQQQQQQQQQPHVLPQPPGFPQWNFPGVMPHMAPGFPPPMTWPGPPNGTPVNNGNNPLAMIPRFPYPPSQQPAGAFPMQFLPPGFPPMSPPGMVMFPGQLAFPGPSSLPCTQVSANNSSASAEGTTAQSPLGPVANGASANANNQRPSGSTQQNTQTGVGLNTTKTPTLTSVGAAHQSTAGVDKRDGLKSVNFVGGAAAAAACENDSSQDDVALRSSCKDTKGLDVSGVASCQKDGGEGTDESQPDLPADKPSDDENSHSGIPPLDFSEGEQRSSYLERNMGSSVPDLEKQSRPGQKGLRHRQSATATVPTTEASENTAQGAEAANPGGGQRIEAASGDTHPRLLRFHHPPRAFAEARIAHRNAVARATQHRTAAQFDSSYFAMLILGIATVLLLLNRLVRMADWSVLL